MRPGRKSRYCLGEGRLFTAEGTACAKALEEEQKLSRTWGSAGVTL